MPGIVWSVTGSLTVIVMLVLLYVLLFCVTVNCDCLPTITMSLMVWLLGLYISFPLYFTVISSIVLSAMLVCIVALPFSSMLPVPTSCPFFVYTSIFPPDTISPVSLSFTFTFTVTLYTDEFVSIAVVFEFLLSTSILTVLFEG